jgi:hypothetical protein
LTPTQKFILAVFGVMIFASVLSVIGLAVLNNQQHATGSPTPIAHCTRLVVGQAATDGGPVVTETFANSDFYGCQTVGMNEDAGIALLKSHGIASRVSTRDGISLPVTADYSEARVNLSVMHSIITAYSVG